MALSLIKIDSKKVKNVTVEYHRALPVLQVVFPYLCRYVEHDDEYSQQYPVNYIIHSDMLLINM
jgi:hypothetical protein